MSPTEAQVAVVGAGASGLAAAAMLEQRGHRPVVLEVDERIGGTWARRYDRLHLHTVRRFSGLPDHPLPVGLPRYVSKDQYADYLASYAAAFDLDVRLGTRVEKIRRQDRGWLVETQREDFRVPVVVISTGKHNRKRLPPWPGVEDFAGRLVHSADYRSGAEFRGLRALVVGIGNSGAEIATDLVDEGASFVAIAVRTTPAITKREIFGIPVQLFGMALEPLPARPVDRVGAVIRRLGTGDLRRYGLGKEAWGPFEARRPPVIDVGFLATLKRGAIAVRPELVRLTPTGAVFSHGAQEPFDVVVVATGFSTALEELVELPGLLDDRGLPRFGAHGAREFPGLYFVGFKESPRGALYEANRDARRLGEAASRYLATAAASVSAN
jgi:cation diffusion facilitator CzcD-associated flavoprotein CzcO